MNLVCMCLFFWKNIKPLCGAGSPERKRWPKGVAPGGCHHRSTPSAARKSCSSTPRSRRRAAKQTLFKPRRRLRPARFPTQIRPRRPLRFSPPQRWCTWIPGTSSWSGPCSSSAPTPTPYAVVARSPLLFPSFLLRSVCPILPNLFVRVSLQTRYVMKYRHCEGKLVLKVTDDREVRPCPSCIYSDQICVYVRWFGTWMTDRWCDLGGDRWYTCYI